MRLLKAKSIVCRAWQGVNTQPKELTWNLLGMMNNCHFKILLHTERNAEGHFGVRFEHPTQAGPQPGGWMVKPQEVVPDTKRTVAPPPIKTGKAGISLKELAKHDTAEDC